MRRGREKFDADALTFFSSLAKKHDARFLLFLRKRIGDDQHGIHVQRLVQIHQSAMRVDDNGFASFAEAAAVGIFSGHHHAHAHEDASAAANFVKIRLGHDGYMLRQFEHAVNGSVGIVFPLCNARVAGFVAGGHASAPPPRASAAADRAPKTRHIAHPNVNG